MKNKMTKEVQQLLAEMKQQMDGIQQKMADDKIEMTNMVQMQQTQIDDMLLHISNLELENTELKQNNINLNSKSEFLAQNLKNVSSVASRLNTFLGFSAYASMTRNYDIGVTIIFDTILTNEGGLYLNESSTFVCGISGFYLFSVQVQVMPGDEIQAELVVGGRSVAAVYAHADIDDGSNTVVVHCDQGGQVVVRGLANGDGMFGDPNHAYSTFTGALLFPDAAD